MNSENRIYTVRKSTYEKTELPDIFFLFGQDGETHKIAFAVRHWAAVDTDLFGNLIKRHKDNVQKYRDDSDIFFDSPLTIPPYFINNLSEGQPVSERFLWIHEQDPEYLPRLIAELCYLPEFEELDEVQRNLIGTVLNGLRGIISQKNNQSQS